MIRQFLRDEMGATSIEYAMIAMIVSVGILASVTLFMASVQAKFDQVSTAVTEVTSR